MSEFNEFACWLDFVLSREEKLETIEECWPGAQVSLLRIAGDDVYLVAGTTAPLARLHSLLDGKKVTITGPYQAEWYKSRFS